MSVLKDRLATLEILLVRHRVGILWIGFLFSVIYILNDLIVRTNAGNTPPYALREMLNNYADGLVRRGLSGSISIWMSDHFGGAPVQWAWALMAAAMTGLTVLCVRLYKALPDTPALVVLVLTPAGLLFFALDPGAAMRKEVFGYVALAMVLQGVLSRSKGATLGWAIVGVAVFLTSLFAHEGILFLWPSLAAALALLAWRWRGFVAWSVGLALCSGIAGICIFWMLIDLPPVDHHVMCAAALQPICKEPYIWLSGAGGVGIEYVLQRRDLSDIPIFIAIYALAFVPFLGLRAQALPSRLMWAIAGFAFIITLPLYAVGFDWGRWMHLSLFPISLLAVAGIIVGVLRYDRLLPPWASLLLVASWSLSHAHAEIAFYGLFVWPVLAGLVVFGWIRVRVVKTSRF